MHPFLAHQHHQAIWSNARTHGLGVVYTPVEDSIRDCALSMFAKGFLEGVIEPVVPVASGAAPGSLAASHPPGHVGVSSAH